MKFFYIIIDFFKRLGEYTGLFFYSVQADPLVGGSEPVPGQVFFQDPCTPIMEAIIELHNTIVFYLILILILVTFVFTVIFFSFREVFPRRTITQWIIDFIGYFIYIPCRFFGFGTEWLFTIKAFIEQLSAKIRLLKEEAIEKLRSLFGIEKPEPMSFRRAAFTRLAMYKIYRKWTHQTQLEIVWTVVPAIILLLIAIPSFVLLYSLSGYGMIGYHDPYALTVKVIGHQWFWEYNPNPARIEEKLAIQVQMGDRKQYSITDTAEVLKDSPSYECYMLNEEELEELEEEDNCLYPRLLTADLFPIRYRRGHCFLVTSVDVLHSWAIPSFGVKVDAVPGRLNQAFVFPKRLGNFYGQCSEICGVNHAFMPIRLVVVLDWNEAVQMSGSEEAAEAYFDNLGSEPPELKRIRALREKEEALEEEPKGGFWTMGTYYLEKLINKFF